MYLLEIISLRFQVCLVMIDEKQRCLVVHQLSLAQPARSACPRTKQEFFIWLCTLVAFPVVIMETRSMNANVAKSEVFTAIFELLFA
jgi:hypothetical protein